MKILHIHLSNKLGTNEALPRALKGISTDYQQVDWLNCQNPTATTLKIAREQKPDLVFMQLQTANVITSDAVDEMRAAGACVISWSGDVREPLPDHYTDLGKHLNATLFTNMPDVETMRAENLPADFLQVGYDPLIYCYDGPKTNCPPIVFMGANYGARKYPNSQARIDMVEALRKEFGSDFAVFGNGWGTRFLQPQEEAAVYRSCKVAIHQDHFTREGFHSDRLLRINGCGAVDIQWPIEDGLIDVYLKNPPSEEKRRTYAEETAATESWDARMPRLMELFEQYKT